MVTAFSHYLTYLLPRKTEQEKPEIIHIRETYTLTLYIHIDPTHILCTYAHVFYIHIDPTHAHNPIVT